MLGLVYSRHCFQAWKLLKKLCTQQSDLLPCCLARHCRTCYMPWRFAWVSHLSVYSLTGYSGFSPVCAGHLLNLNQWGDQVSNIGVIPVVWLLYPALLWLECWSLARVYACPWIRPPNSMLALRYNPNGMLPLDTTPNSMPNSMLALRYNPKMAYLPFDTTPNGMFALRYDPKQYACS